MDEKNRGLNQMLQTTTTTLSLCANVEFHQENIRVVTWKSETKDEEKKVLILESEARTASSHFVFIKVYVTALYMEHFHSAFYTDPLKMYDVLNCYTEAGGAVLSNQAMPFT